jgi:DNA invertase Pin-like site-specific DNA recombinase
MGNTQIVGYIRVSSVDQNLARQLHGDTLDRTFEDKVSGSSTDRPGLIQAMAYCRAGDTFRVHSMDRLARSLKDLLDIVNTLNEKGVQVQFVKEGLTFTGDDTSAAKLLLQVMGAVAEFERSIIRERQREGIAIAKANGVYKGRVYKLSAEQAQDVCRRVAAGENQTDIAREYGVTRMTVWRYVQEAKKKAQ